MEHNDGSGMDEDEDGDDPGAVPASLPPPYIRRIMGARVPVWALAMTVAVVAIGFGVLLVLQARSAVHLGPAVGVAERLDVKMTLCNHDVDHNHINPRTAELDLEKLLREQGAREVDVVVERQDCPTPSP